MSTRGATALDGPLPPAPGHTRRRAQSSHRGTLAPSPSWSPAVPRRSAAAGTPGPLQQVGPTRGIQIWRPLPRDLRHASMAMYDLLGLWQLMGGSRSRAGARTALHSPEPWLCVLLWLGSASRMSVSTKPLRNCRKRSLTCSQSSTGAIMTFITGKAACTSILQSANVQGPQGALGRLTPMWPEGTARRRQPGGRARPRDCSGAGIMMHHQHSLYKGSITVLLSTFAVARCALPL